MLKGDITPIKLASGEIVALHTIIDLNNAHAVEAVSFLKRNTGGPAETIPFEIDDDYEASLKLRSGADCAISGMRAYQDGRDLRVVYATRKGEWSEKNIVQFHEFYLTKNNDGAPGTPSNYFKERKTYNSKKTYCDVNRAIDNEATPGKGAK